MLRVCVVSYTVAPAAAVAMRGTPVAAEKEELEPVDRARMGPFDVDRLLRQPVPGACAANGALHDSDLNSRMVSNGVQRTMARAMLCIARLSRVLAIFSCNEC